MTILPGLLLDLATPSKFGKIHQCRTAQFIFYIDGTDHVVLGPSKRGKNNLSEEHHVLTSLS